MSAPELKPCPFCKGDAERDYLQPYRSLAAGRLGKACAIYCTDCGAEMVQCHEDHEEVSPDDLMAMMVEAWNRRAIDPAQIRADALREAADDAAGEVAAHGASELSPFVRRRILALIDKPKGGAK